MSPEIGIQIHISRIAWIQFWPINSLFANFFIFNFALVSGLVDCDYYQTNEYNYTHFVELSSLKDAQPTDYWARVPVYVIGPRDAHIILSTTNTPNRDVDFVYEIRKLHNTLNGFIRVSITGARYISCR